MTQDKPREPVINFFQTHTNASYKYQRSPKNKPDTIKGIMDMINADNDKARAIANILGKLSRGLRYKYEFPTYFMSLFIRSLHVSQLTCFYLIC